MRVYGKRLWKHFCVSMLIVRRVARTRVFAILSHLKVRVSCREEVNVATLAG